MALAIVPVFAFGVVGSPERLPLVLLVAIPLVELGVACYSVLGRVIRPALGPAAYRETYGSSPERVFAAWGATLPAGIATPPIGQPIAPAVRAIRTANPWLPLWDAVAVVRLAQNATAPTA